MKKILYALCITVSTLSLTACGIGDTNTTYNRADIGRQGKVSIGKIISMMQIDIEGSNELGGTVGAGVGGLAGAIGGNMFGGGRGKALMTLAGGTIGALAGASVGAKAEQSITSDTAFEFIIQKNDGSMINIVQTNELGLKPGDNVVIVENGNTTRIRSKM